MRTHTKDDLRVAEEAADWLLRLEQEDTPECHAEFVAWTKLSARNLHEFLFAKATSQELGGIDPGKTIDLDSLDTAESVVSLHADEAVTPSALAAPLVRDAPAPRRRRYLMAGVAAALIPGLAFAWFFLSSRSTSIDSYSTAVGEQRSFKLGDGSLIHLNTGSHVEVRFSSEGRDLKLLDGEALFVVAHDARRPFRVDVGAATVQAVGTQFNVYRRGAAATVSVIEGRVRISDQARRNDREAGAGEQARIASDHGIEKRATPDIARALAWRERRLVFRATPLAEVAEEFNRYNSRQIRVEGVIARERQMSGVFDADDPQPLLRFLGNDAQLSIETAGDRIVIRSQ